MALGIAPSCYISIFSFLRFLTIYQVTATILFSNIPLLAVVRYDSVACSDPITFWFIDFSSLCCCFSTEQIFFLLIMLQIPVTRMAPSFLSYILFLFIKKYLYLEEATVLHQNLVLNHWICPTSLWTPASITEQLWRKTVMVQVITAKSWHERIK